MGKLRIVVAGVITVVWAAGYVITYFDHTFSPPPEVSGLMLGVVTWLFTTEARDRLKKGISIKIGTDEGKEENGQQSQPK